MSIFKSILSNSFKISLRNSFFFLVSNGFFRNFVSAYFFSESLEEMEKELNKETWKFYQKLDASGNGSVSRPQICRDKEGSILTGGLEEIER